MKTNVAEIAYKNTFDSVIVTTHVLIMFTPFVRSCIMSRLGFYSSGYAISLNNLERIQDTYLSVSQSELPI